MHTQKIECHSTFNLHSQQTAADQQLIIDIIIDHVIYCMLTMLKALLSSITIYVKQFTFLLITTSLQKTLVTHWIVVMVITKNLYTNFKSLN